MNAISFWTGIVGGVAGIVGGAAGLLALYDRFRHRKPRLNAVAPCCFSGLDGPAKHPLLNIYLRIANRAKASAFLYLETMLVKVLFEGR